MDTRLTGKWHHSFVFSTSWSHVGSERLRREKAAASSLHWSSFPKAFHQPLSVNIPQSTLVVSQGLSAKGTGQHLTDEMLHRLANQYCTQYFIQDEYPERTLLSNVGPFP